VDDLWIFILIAVLVAYFVLSYILFLRIFKMHPEKEYKVVDQNSDFFKASYEWFQKVPKEEISIKSYDNVTLKGQFIPSIDNESTNLAIVVHGYHASLQDMIIIGKFYSDLGFKVMLLDMRGHGQSEGSFTTLGHYEKYDLKKWIHFALRTYGATDKILLHGVSMGASTIFLSTTLNLPQNVKFIVADSGFDNAWNMLWGNLRPKSLRILLPGASIISLFSKRFFLSSVNVAHAVRKNKIPLIIIHGEKDEKVPFEVGKSLHELSKAPTKDFYQIPNCKHGEGYIVDKAGYEQRVILHLKDYFTIKNTYLKQKK